MLLPGRTVMGNDQDPVQEFARRKVIALDEKARDMLQVLALLPPRPNDVAKDAVLCTSAGYLAELETLTNLGAVQETAANRYTIADIFRPALEIQIVPAERKRRLVRYYADYAYLHSDDRASIEAEYANLKASLSMAASVGAGDDMKRIVLGLADCVVVRGDFRNWRSLLEKALQLPDSTPSDHLVPMLLLHLARLQLRQEDPESARSSALRALEMEPDAKLERNLEILLGHAALDASRYEEAESRLRRALNLSETAGDGAAIRQALVILGTALTRRRKYAEAEKYTERGLKEAEAAEDLPVVASLATNLGVLQYHQKQYGKAIETFDRALPIARSVRFREKEGALLHAKAGALIELGFSDEALRILDEALIIFDEIQHNWYTSITLKERGLAHLELGDPQSSLNDFKESMESSPGVKEIEAHCLWGSSRAYAQLGKPEQALDRAHLSVSLFEEIEDHRAVDARRWLESLAV